MILKFQGATLDSPTIDLILDKAEEYNILPSFLITQLHYEGLWGKSEVSRLNNNLGGMTWSSTYVGNPKIKKSKGSARPANEGGHYIKYNSVADFIHDWAYLLRPHHFYVVSGKKSFQGAVKGLFRYGGAKYDYATMNVDNTEERYKRYLVGMESRRKAINEANQGALDELDQKFKGDDEMAVTAEQVLAEARKHLGVTKWSQAHKNIINAYNAVLPRPVGYAVTYNDDWCDAFVTFVSDKAGASNLIGRECGVERHKNIFKQKGIWIGLVRPQAGDIVTFHWGGQRNGFAHHIGFVERVNGETITTIEGNTTQGGVSKVGRNTFSWNSQYIQGYARPKYGASAKGTKSNLTIAKEVLQRKWGDGQERITRLKSAGYDPNKVQSEVNKLMAKKPLNQVAKEVLKGKYGNGAERVKKLKAEGYDPVKVQEEVNRLDSQPKENIRLADKQPAGGVEVQKERLKDNEVALDGTIYVIEKKK